MQTMDVITTHRLKQIALDAGALAAIAPRQRAQKIYEAFLERVPYENLSNNRVACELPDEPEVWPRATDRLLRENATHGLGGTSFSLSYALRDLLRGAGLTAHCALGHNLVTEQAHAAVIMYGPEGPLLYDPALLMAGPVPVRPGGELRDPLGTIRLEPRCGPTLTVTLHMHCGAPGARNRRPAWSGAPRPTEERAIYSIIPMPAPPESFRKAWQASFYRGRPMPLRFARRMRDRIYRYGERPGSIEILTAKSREELPVDGDAARQLHEIFGINEDCLRQWFGRHRRA